MVAIAIAAQAKFVQPIVLLSLSGNCLSLGFKIRTLPTNIDDVRAYMDLQALYDLLGQVSENVKQANVSGVETTTEVVGKGSTDGEEGYPVAQPEMAQNPLDKQSPSTGSLSHMTETKAKLDSLIHDMEDVFVE